MQIQVNTDHNIEGGEELSREVASKVEGDLKRFSKWITRLEVHFSDEDSSIKSGKNDKRCLLEARPKGLQPISASHHGQTLDEALSGATIKLTRLLDGTLR